jgi:hypothetical protein
VTWRSNEFWEQARKGLAESALFGCGWMVGNPDITRECPIDERIIAYALSEDG